MTDDLTPHKERVLRLLATLGGKAYGPEIDAAADKTVHGHLDKLQKSGYVNNRPALKGDGRKHIWELTTAGQRVVRQEAAEWHAAALGISGTNDTTDGGANR